MAGFIKSGGTSKSDITVPAGRKSTLQSKRVDLAFVMDCTGSMDSYIEQARNNVIKIAEELKRHVADYRFALVEYRDHPQEGEAGESGFVTKVINFTEHLKEIQRQFDQCTAEGGGDPPEAIADALDEVLNLSWRGPAVKICMLIADAPPHGLGHSGDAFDSGCPCGKDPMAIAHKLAEKAVMVYTVGCEPSVTPYKDWFMAISHITSGQYLPLASATPLFQAIIGAVFEGLSLSDITAIVGTILMTSNRRMTAEETADLVTKQLSGSTTKQLESNKGAIQKPTPQALAIANLRSMADVRRIFKPNSESSSSAAESFTVVEKPVTKDQVLRVVKQVFASSSGGPLMTSKTAEFVKL